MKTAYDHIGLGYSSTRRTDPRWMAAIERALGDARAVVDVGAGTGSYEGPATVLAVDPSMAMVRQRTGDMAPVVQGVAERLPLRDRAVDAALAVLTVHHWSEWRRGVAELRRVADRQVVLAYEPWLHCQFWLVSEYIPEIAEVEAGRASATEIAEELGAGEVVTLPVPWDMTDGVFPAHWRRPAAYLLPEVRRGCSALAQADPDAVCRGLTQLQRDLETGCWHRRHADLLERKEIDAGFRLIVR